MDARDRRALVAPTVHAEHCVGCGLREEACIVYDRKAIRVVTGRSWA